MPKPVSPVTLYLAAYNVLSAAGWAVVLRTTATAYLAGSTPAQLWADVGDSLCLVQTAAALEMLHSLFRLTRSPFAATFMQVCFENTRRRHSLLSLEGRVCLPGVFLFSFYLRSPL